LLAPQDDEQTDNWGKALMGGWCYMLRCADESFYVGSTSYDEVDNRVAEHSDGRYVGYTTTRRPVLLVWSRWFDDLRDAHAAERRLKGWSRAKKRALIADDEAALMANSVRRAGKAACQSIRLIKRELAALAQSTNAARTPDCPSALPRKKNNAARTGGSDIPMVKLADGRHPEVRPEAKRRGAPKDA
jgi:putative endonuclease